MEDPTKAILDQIASRRSQLLRAYESCVTDDAKYRISLMLRITSITLDSVNQQLANEVERIES